LKGWVTDIVRGSFHDGPGIRTVVFLQGCPLRCAWCHNPETWSAHPVPLFYPNQCLGCGACGGLAENADRCRLGARSLSSVERTVEEVMTVIRKDRPFYAPEGGVTFTGGEPCSQPDFLLALLAQCRAEAIPAAIETSLHVPADVLGKVLPLLNVLMADLKLVDPERHRRATGVSNDLILKNFAGLRTTQLPVIVRTPLVAEVNDDDANIEQTVEILKPLKTLVYYELLRYQPLGQEKYVALGRKAPAFQAPSDERLRRLCQIIQDAGIPPLVDGVRA
jgi:pyruvate formate lyase activating enzyme